MSEPVWFQNMVWLLQDGVRVDPDSYLGVLSWAATHVDRWIDISKDGRSDVMLGRLHRLYFDFADWSQLWHEVGSQADGLTPILVTTRRLAGLVNI